MQVSSAESPDDSSAQIEIAAATVSAPADPPDDSSYAEDDDSFSEDGGQASELPVDPPDTATAATEAQGLAIQEPPQEPPAH